MDEVKASERCNARILFFFGHGGDLIFSCGRESVCRRFERQFFSCVSCAWIADSESNCDTKCPMAQSNGCSCGDQDRRPTNREHNGSEEGCDVPGHKSQTGQRKDAGLEPGTSQSEPIQERKITGLKTGHYQGKAAAGLPHSNTARFGRRPLQRRSTVVGFGCDIWGTNGGRRSYHPASAWVCSKKTYGA